MSYGSMHNTVYFLLMEQFIAESGPWILFILRLQPYTKDLAALFGILCISPAGGVGSGGRQEGYYRQCLEASAFHSFHILLSGTQTALEGKKFNKWYYNERKRHKAKMNSQSVSATVCLTIIRV